MAWAPDYVTVAQLAAFLRIDDAEDDTELGYAISAASRAVDSHTHRQFGKVDAPEERVYEARWDRHRRRWVVTIDDLMDDTITVTNDDGVEIVEYTLEPRNAAVKSRPWTMLVLRRGAGVIPTGEDRLVTISGPWGWTAVPDPVKQATLLQASRFHSRRFSPYGIAGNAEQGSELRLLARVDPDVGVSLKDFVRWWVAG